MAESHRALSARAADAEKRLDELEKLVSCCKPKSSKAEPVIIEQKPHPPWIQPTGEPGDLMVQNSLCPKELTPFIPANGNTVKWYSCGPTVYAPAHLGHARSYVTFDMMRRLYTDYFGYLVHYCENITDVDDKIIKRARQNYLVDAYLQENTDDNVLRKDIVAAFDRALKKHDTGLAETQQKLDETKDSRFKKTLEQQIVEGKAKKKLTEKDMANFQSSKDRDGMLKFGRSVLAEAIDSEKKSTVSDHSIFRAHAERFEIEFWEDMRTLNVRDPDVVTRVTEYVDDIIHYCKQIIDNGYGYVSNGSVYFDSAAFSKTHDYAKLEPKSAGDQAKLEEGEGDMDETSERKRPSDFALWKKSKAGEPMWKSEWGMGRPGWHIECSAMCSDVHGDTLDIHTGGEDLKFPHHDNEIAQCEAYYSKDGHVHKQWCNYFFHAGHLNIDGLKMSKSLKNFFSIREILEKYSWRQIRILFSLQPWHAKLNFSFDTLKESQTKEKQLTEFFLNIRAFARSLEVSSTLGAQSQRWTKEDRELNDAIVKCMTDVDTHMRTNFAYHEAMMCFFSSKDGLIGSVNKYLQNDKVEVPKVLLLNKAGDFVNNILKVLGIVQDGHDHFLGPEHGKLEAELTNLLDLACNARNEIMTIIRGGADKAQAMKEIRELVKVYKQNLNSIDDKYTTSESMALSKSLENSFSKFLNAVESASEFKDIMIASDELRDQGFFGEGVQLEDAHGRSLWKLYYPKSILLSAQIEEEIEKLENKLKAREREQKQWLGKATAVADATKSDEEVAAMGKGAKKKYQKYLKKCEKQEASYQKKIKAEPSFMDDLAKEIASIQEEIQAKEALLK